MIYDVTDLEVYNRSLKTLALVYQLEKQIPNSHFQLRKQLTSAAEGVPAQIAEGFAKRRSAKEFKRYLEIAMGSSDEVITHTRSIKILATHIKGIDRQLCDRVIAEYKIISKQLNRLRNKWIDYQKHK
jgi:four helix bundle protein